MRGRQEIPLRDVEWLSAFCCDKTADPDKSALADELCALAVERFCEPRPPRPTYYSPHYRREASVSETSLPLLLKALAASGRDEDLSRVIHFVRGIAGRIQPGRLPGSLPEIVDTVVAEAVRLGSSATGVLAGLRPPTARIGHRQDSRRRRPIGLARRTWTCKCQYCAQLKAFLADPANEVGRIAAREDMRQHLIGIIDRHQCDVKHALERKGSPYSLVLTKTTGSFERAVKRFEADRRLLSELPTAS